MSPTLRKSIPPDVVYRAAEWLVELQAQGVTEEVRKSWQRWRDANPDHELAWQRVEALSGKLQTLPAPVAHATLTSTPALKRRQTIKVLSLLVAGGATWMAVGKAPWQKWTADYSTRIGQRSSLTLADGTRIDLNTDSAIDVRYDDVQRRVVLLSGEMLVTTAHDPALGDRPARPFLVETEQGRIHALGTRFSTRLWPVDSQVEVFDGAVDIRVADAPEQVHIVHAGEQMRFSRTQITSLGVADAAQIAWAVGMLVVNDMRLADFLVELNRYRHGRLACDPAIADLKVSGTYPLDDIDRILRVLRATLPVEIHTLTQYWVTVRPRATPA